MQSEEKLSPSMAKTGAVRAFVFSWFASTCANHSEFEDDVPTSSDRIQVSGKRAGRGLANTPVKTVGHDSTRKRKRKGPIANNTLTAAADHDSDMNESESGDDDNDYIPNGSGYAISKGVKQSVFL